METDAVFEKLQAAFPLSGSAQTSPILATGQVALERRSFSSRTSPLHRRDHNRSPALSDHSVHSTTPLFSDLGFRNAELLGVRSISSSPGSGRIDVAGGRRGKAALTPLVLKTKRLRPSSELFLPTPVDPSKRVTIFRLPADRPKPIQTSLANELFLPTPPQSGEYGSSISVPKTVIQEGNNDDHSDDEEPTSPEGPPLSPISSAMARARFSRLDVHDSVRHMVSNLNVITEHPYTFHSRALSTPVTERASTVPPTLQRTLSVATIKTFRSAPVRNGSIRPGGGRSRAPSMRPLSDMLKKRGTRYSGIDKDVTAARRATALSLKQRSEIGPTAAAASPLSPIEAENAVPVRTGNSVLPWRRKRRGETMSMLLDAGFFPVNEYIYNEEPSQPKRTPSKKVRALSIIIDDLPLRPSSIVGTPTEFYIRGLPGSPRRHIRGNPNRSLASRKRAIGQVNRSPMTPRRTIVANALALSPFESPTTPSTPSSAFFALTGSLTSPTLTPLRASFATTSSSVSPVSPPEGSPGILEVIPEADDDDEGDSNQRKQTPVLPHDSMILTEEPLDLLPNVPIKTEIHLSSGTVLTVCPPELTAWTQNTYVHGPIILPTPTLAPRKDSIATLEPFQTAVDHIYDHVLQIPRRASEDQVMDDLLEWYDEWGFGEPVFAFDDFKENVGPEDSFDADKDWSSSSPMSQQMVTQLLDSRAEPLGTVSENPASLTRLSSSVSAPLSAVSRDTNTASRKRSTTLPFNGTSALSPLPESPSTSPRTSRVSLSLATAKPLPAVPPPAPPVKHRVSQADMWGDDDSDGEEAPSRPSWLPGAHTHLEIREIRGVRPVSMAARRESQSTVESGDRSRMASVGSDVGVATVKIKQVKDKKSKGATRRTVRRFVGGIV